MDDKTDSYNVTAEADQAHDDQWLADAIVALGVGKATEWVPDVWRYDINGSKDMPDIEFVCDWRVAGACLELWPTTINTEHLDCTLDEMLRDPRAIIEAYVGALS